MSRHHDSTNIPKTGNIKRLTYHAPELLDHGTVRKATLAGGPGWNPDDPDYLDYPNDSCYTG